MDLKQEFGELVSSINAWNQRSNAALQTINQGGFSGAREEMLGLVIESRLFHGLLMIVLEVFNAWKPAMTPERAIYLRDALTFLNQIQIRAVTKMELSIQATPTEKTQ